MDRGETTQLLIKARDGDAQALDDLCARVGSRLLAIVRLRLGQSLAARVDAEDVAQETLLKAFRHIRDFERDTSRSLFAWLAIIAGRVIADLAAFHHQPKRDFAKTVDALSDRLSAGLRSGLSRLIADESLAELERGLAALSEAQRQVILLRFLEERSFREIGALTDRSEDAARMAFNRAMTRLTLALSPKAAS